MNSPTFFLEKKKLEANLVHFTYLAKETGIVWLYTLKAFHEDEGLEMIAQTFDGFSIGNKNEFNKVKKYHTKLHSYAPAYYENEVENLAKESETMSFNSLTQWQNYASLCEKYTSLGIRINPKLSLPQPSYCDSNISRLGMDYEVFLAQFHTFEKLEGLHFHALCYQNFQALDKLFDHIEEHYQELLPKLKWINLGGGQNFTDVYYDTQAFILRIKVFKRQYPHLIFYFEPGSAVVEKTGYFKCTVLDIIDAKVPIVILDTSIETHLLDVAIAKIKPKVRGTTTIEGDYPYELTGMSCIAGDSLGIYNFKKRLKVGDKIIFEDMLGYTLVKQTSFNGLKEVRFKVI